MEEKLRQLIQDLDETIRRLRIEIHSNSQCLAMVAGEMQEGSANDGDWETIQVTPLCNSSELELMMKIAEHNARLLCRNAIQRIIEDTTEGVG